MTYALQFYVPLTFLGPAVASSWLAQFIRPDILDYAFRALLVLVTCEFV